MRLPIVFTRKNKQVQWSPNISGEKSQNPVSPEAGLQCTRAYHRVTPQKQRNTIRFSLFALSLDEKLQVSQLLRSRGHAVVAGGALVLLVEDGPAPSSLVKGKDLDTSALNTLENVVVAANVLLEAVNADNVCFRRCGRDVSTGIKAGVGRACDPLFLVARHFALR